MHTTAPVSVDPAGSVLFLGAGFSHAAKNINNQHLPTANQLRNIFARRLDLPLDTPHDLRTLATAATERPDLDVYNMLYRLFTVRALQSDQEEILRHRWWRIYTTNYDDAVEFSYIAGGRSRNFYTYEDDKPRKLPSGSVIHLHGYIGRCDAQNVMNQLILDDTAYAKQHFDGSDWYDDFSRDLRFCEACFFVGYGLRDYNISSLLLMQPEIGKKTFFVIKETESDRIVLDRLQSYGSLLPIGVSGFADFCKTKSIPTSHKDPGKLKAFRHLHPYRDKKTVALPTASEVFSLVAYGTFNEQRCMSTLPRAHYVVPRQEIVQEAVNQFDTARCLLVHSRLGNGKSIFLRILAYALAERGYSSYLCASNPRVLANELEYLKSVRNLVVIFDSYDTAIEVIPEIADCDQAKFVVSIRTGLHDVRLHEIQRRLPNPLMRVSLNGFRSGEVEDFKNLLDHSGLHARDLEGVIDRCRDFREVVLSLYNHKTIREKIDKELSPLLRDRKFSAVFVTSHLLRWAGHDVDGSFLRSVTGVDAYAEVAKHPEIAREMFNMDDDFIQVRSAMFSEHVIQNHCSVEDIIEYSYHIIVQASQRKPERQYQGILGSVIRFSFLQSALSNDSNWMSAITRLYERLRYDVRVKEEPLFWLQYAILKSAAHRLDEAEQFIMTAYAKAYASPGFQTFQIDTYALGLFLSIETNDRQGRAVARFDEIVKKMERVRSMIAEPSIRHHAVEVLDKIEPFVRACRSALSDQERTALVYHLRLMMESLDGLSADDRTGTGSERIRISLDSAKNFLVRTR